MSHTRRYTCDCPQGYHYVLGGSVHLYLTWLCEHLGVQAAREDVRLHTLPAMVRQRKRKLVPAENVRVLRRFVGRSGK